MGDDTATGGGLKHAVGGIARTVTKGLGHVASAVAGTTASGPTYVDPKFLEPKTILLIGSTGNGKSTLGNFLLYTDSSVTHFETAIGNEPQTQHVSYANSPVRSDEPLLQVIDTPGLNESASADLKHMIDIVAALSYFRVINACILCVKFDSKIDMQYKATIEYYRKLLPMLFERNVVIVLTNFATDSRSEKIRQRQKIDVDLVIKNTRKTIKEVGNLSYLPQHFLLDSVPMSEQELVESTNTRYALINYISSLRPINVRDIMVAKTPGLKQHDIAEIRQLNGEIAGYNSRLKKTNSKAERVLSEIEQKEKEKSERECELENIRLFLLAKDTDELATAQEWSIDAPWKLLQWQAKEFDVKSPYQVVEHTTWDNGHLIWKDVKVTLEGASGRVEGRFCRGLYANLTLSTTMRHKYKPEIDAKCKEQEAHKNRVKDLLRDLESCKEQHEECLQEIEDLRSYINTRNEAKEVLSRDSITIEEARKRLEQLLQTDTKVQA